MMVAAVIYVDPQTIQPVLNGKWHRMDITAVPRPGDTVTMLCGESGAAEFKLLGQRRADRIHQQCESCDDVLRRREGIPLRRDRIGRR
ncbi:MULTISPECIES: hypothetical protein [unclassified Amycolatopsis]|uniref:hypothetical protein n=1 Tax=unclassified Amycolatopsis TaxID=2618356 RepID=UPI002875C4C5|nr:MULTISPECIES: hypothetical protein [unclassified Amycolatopsis]MDS0133198.1 hypothetical protein [Amycolatopsis sp. 505]MDS0146428.1 hypothetical protein [Amycolatopsis sp. CM201R]